MTRAFFISFLFMSAIALAEAPLTFDKALDTILERSTNIAIQRTHVEAASDSLTGAKSAFLPTLSFNASQSKYSDNSPVSNAAGASANVNLFRGGADLNGVRAARSELQSQNATLEDTRLSQESDGVQALVNQIDKELEVQVLQKNVDNFKTYVNVAQQRYSKGLLPLQEVDKVSVDLANVESRLNDVKIQRFTAAQNLERLLGKEAVLLEWPWKARVADRAVEKLVSREFDLKARPDYQAAVAELEAQDRKESQTFGLVLPSLDFGLSYGTFQTLNGLETGLLAGNTTTSVTLSLSMPLFDRLQEYTGYRVQQQRRAEFSYRLEQIKRDALAQWEAARGNFKTALTTALAREKTLEISQKLYAANLSRFRQGHATANDLQVDEARLRDSEIFAIQGWAGAHVAFMQLCHSLGRSVKNCE